MHWAKGGGLFAPETSGVLHARLQDSELALLQDMSHLQAIKQDLAAVTTNRHRLPDKSVQVVEVGRGRGKEGGEGRGGERRGGVCQPALWPVLVPSLLSAAEHNPAQ